MDHIDAAGFSSSVKDIVKSAGGYPETLIEVKKLLDAEELTEEEIARVVMNYVDGYTRDAAWAEAAFEEGGSYLNDVDRRRMKTDGNPNYARTEAEAQEQFGKHDFFGGKKSAQALADVSHIAEKKLTDMIEQRSHIKIDPVRLPEFIDQCIREKIDQL